MKISEFRKLIREEVKKALTEGQYKTLLNEVGEGLKLPAVKQDLIEE